MIGVVEFVIYPAVAVAAMLTHWLVRRRANARASAQLGTPFRISAELRSPGWRLLFDDRGRQLAVLSDEVKAVVAYDRVVGWRQEQVVELDGATGAPDRSVLIRTDDPRWPVLEIPLGTSDAGVASLWLRRLNANVQHLRTVTGPAQPTK